MPSDFQNTLFGLLFGCFVYHNAYSFPIRIPTQIEDSIQLLDLLVREESFLSSVILTTQMFAVIETFLMRNSLDSWIQQGFLLFVLPVPMLLTFYFGKFWYFHLSDRKCRRNFFFFENFLHMSVCMYVFLLHGMQLWNVQIETILTAIMKF